VADGSELDRKDVLLIDELMRQALGGASDVLGLQEKGGTHAVFTLRATREGEPMELLRSPINQGNHRFSVVVNLNPTEAEGLVLRRLRSCLSGSDGK